MTRAEFVKMCGLLGVGLPLHATYGSRNSQRLSPKPDNVLIIGAGAAGLTVGYLLAQQGISFRILEASATYGGRMRRNNSFVDFPIPLGAEWLHVERQIFDEIINDPTAQFQIDTLPYDSERDLGLLDGGMVSAEDIGFTIDQKFINATWFDFFEEYICPSVKDDILYEQVVSTVDYSSENVRVKTSDDEFHADKVVVTVPVKMLQNQAIDFIPELPKEKIKAIQGVTVWDGCKAFVEFSEKFYPTFVGYDIRPSSAGQKLYYDAAYGQKSSRNVLGLFAVGIGTLPYVELSDKELIAYMLQELDEIFDGKASACYVKHIFQNWNNEPFTNGAYIMDHENWRRVRTLGKPVGHRLFFAGDGYTDGEDWSSVHTAARSAIRAVQAMTGT